MNSMKLRLLLMGTILIILSVVLFIRRYSEDDFILTIVGIILLVTGIIWKNKETKKVLPPSSTS